jgi:hypothetical protein
VAAFDAYRSTLDPSEPRVLSSRPVVEGREPVRAVAHEESGHWTFIAGVTGGEPEDDMVVGLNAVLERHPDVAALLDLPPGMQATRDDPSRPWRIEPIRVRRRRGGRRRPSGG